MDPAMGNWSENQVFKIPVSHLSLPLWTSIPSSFPWTEQDALLAKKKEFLNYLCFLFERILWDWGNSCCWSWDSMSLGWLLSLELRYPKIWGNGCYWIWDTPRLGSFLLWELGEGGSCGSGSPHGFQVDVGLTDRCSSTWGIPSTAPGVLRKELGWLRRELWLVASDWGNGNLCMRHQKLNPNPQHFTSPSKCSSGSVQGSRSAWDITSECFSRERL